MKKAKILLASALVLTSIFSVGIQGVYADTKESAVTVESTASAKDKTDSVELEGNPTTGYEWQYENINRGIIVQPDLGQLKDWNFWCENGEIKYVQTARKLGKNLEEFLTFTDADGNTPDAYIGVKPMRLHLLESEKVILEKMKPIVKKLASDFKFVHLIFLSALDVK